jgi:hypothetical protein
MLLGCCLMVSPSLMAASASDIPFLFGVGLHLGQSTHLNADSAAAMMTRVGFNSFRDEASWGRIEGKPNSLVFPDNLAELDRLIKMSAAGKKFYPLLVLDYGNNFYDGGDMPRSGAALDGFARYAKFIAQRYAGQVAVFEIWNEWNGGMGSKAQPRQKGSPDDYMKLLSAVVPAIRSAAPNAIILAGATAGVDIDWSKRFAELGGLALVDGFSVHAYNYRHPLRRLPEDAIGGVDKLEQTLVKASGKASVPLYVTEIGMPTNGGSDGYSEDAVGAYAMRFLLLARSLPYMRGVWWYDMQDDGDDDKNPEHRFGLTRRSGDNKPAADAIKSVLAAVSGGSGFKTDVKGDGYTVSWKGASGESYQAAWTTHASSALAPSLTSARQVNWWQPPGKMTSSTRALDGATGSNDSTVPKLFQSQKGN